MQTLFAVAVLYAAPALCCLPALPSGLSLRSPPALLLPPRGQQGLCVCRRQQLEPGPAGLPPASRPAALGTR